MQKLIMEDTAYKFFVAVEKYLQGGALCLTEPRYQRGSNYWTVVLDLPLEPQEQQSLICGE